MSAAEITYGKAQEVADYLGWSSNVTHGELVGALVNALTRINNLERQVERLTLETSNK